MVASTNFPQVFEDKLIDRSAIEREKISEDISNTKARELKDNPIQGDYDIKHLAAIHKHLFEDVSTLAGKVRDYGMSKGTNFAEPSQLPYLFNKELPQRIEYLNQSVNDKDKYINGMTDLHSTLDLAHPFREGNGRSTRVFMSQLAKEHGYTLDLSHTEGKEWVQACIHSINSGNDDRKQPIFEKVVTPTRERIITNAKESLKGDNSPENKAAIVKELLENNIKPQDIKDVTPKFIKQQTNDVWER